MLRKTNRRRPEMLKGKKDDGRQQKIRRMMKDDGREMRDAMMDFDVRELLPQRPPFIMVDKLTRYDPLRSVTVFTVRRDNLFCKNGVMEEAGLIENIAQTCAAKTGYRNMTGTEHGGGAVKIGLIGMIRQMDIYRNPRVGEQLTTTVEIREEVFNATLVGAKVETGEELIATCEMKIYLTGKEPVKH